MIDRRGFLAAAGGALGAALTGCNGPRAATVVDAEVGPLDFAAADFGGSIDRSAVDHTGAAGCVSPSQGKGLRYCLVENAVVRVHGAARLGAGQVVLKNVDDQTAAIVARDVRGFYGLSGICPHACCVVDLCGDAECLVLRTNPGDCMVTPVTTLVEPGRAFFCPCHGSEYGADGAVHTGPSTANLPSVRVTLDGDDVLVDLGVPAAPGDRTPPV